MKQAVNTSINKTDKISLKKEKEFLRVLMDWYQYAGRHELPWRQSHRSAYQVWVSEVMLQQTQVSRVIGYYEKFLMRFPTVESLAAATWEEFLPYYQGLGYYSRGRNMIATAKLVVAEHGDAFPDDYSLLRRLPGVGDYTANAILAFAYNMPVLAVDTNLVRVLGRYFSGTRDTDKAEIQKLFGEMQNISQKSLSSDHQSLSGRELNAALMDLGSSHCVRNPKCQSCPLQKHCVYFQASGETEIKKTKKVRNTQKVGASMVVLHRGHLDYYSAQSTEYVPFYLPTGVLTRSQIKAHFLDTYGLTVSVRPPSATFAHQGQIWQQVNVQILAGKPEFTVFPKSAFLQYNKSITS